jgi:hypothetical protein
MIQIYSNFVVVSSKTLIIFDRNANFNIYPTNISLIASKSAMLRIMK